MRVARFEALDCDRKGRHDAADGPVLGDQAPASRLPAVLPDGRLLRAVLRGRGAGGGGSRHRADQAGQVRGPGHPDGRRAGAQPRRLCRAADPRRLQGSVCEQTEDPAEAKKRGGKAVVAREVVRVVTPGTLTEETLLDARRPNYLAALAEAAGKLAIAWIDISTGELQAQSVDRRRSRGCSGAAGAGRDAARRRAARTRSRSSARGPSGAIA